MKIAVIRTGGKQYVVKEKDKLKVEKLVAEGAVELETLLIADGDKVEIGTPVLASKTQAKVLRQARTRKVIGVKYKPKTREHKKFGHRQFFTELEIGKI
ncbi:MAG: 50S ribosomal protein L21 [Patescibacteria group bacterium]